MTRLRGVARLPIVSSKRAAIPWHVSGLGRVCVVAKNVGRLSDLPSCSRAAPSPPSATTLTSSTMSTSVLVSTFAPFSTLALSVPSQTSFGELYELLAERYPDLPLHSNAADLVLTPRGIGLWLTRHELWFWPVRAWSLRYDAPPL